MALALLGACLLGVLTVVTGAMSLSERNEQLTVATEVARAQMEAIKELGFSRAPKARSRRLFDGTAKPTTPAESGFPPPPYPFQERNGVRYALKVTVLDLRRTLKSVRVEVRWHAHSEVTYASYLHP